MLEQIDQRQLAERVKELSCLYAVTRIAHTHDVALNDLLKRVVDVIPQGWQYAETALVWLELDDRTFGTPEQVQRTMVATLEVDGSARGMVTVAYPDSLVAAHEPLFLPEEQQLLDRIAIDLSMIIERHERRERQVLLESRMRSNDRLTVLAEITAGIAHELNTPLGNVLGYAELLKKDERAPERRSDLQRIIDSALISREIVKKLMYFSCEMPAQFQLADANKALHEVVHLLDHRLKQQQVSVQWHLIDRLPSLRFDQVQFAQVVTNIVLNAAAAMPKGGEIRIASLQADGTVHLSFSDIGSGIDPENLKKIFQPFFTTKPIGEGTGLGLSVVHGIMKSHGGTVSVRSTPGHGTTFTLSFPIPAA